jgi:hypothetical protein
MIGAPSTGDGADDDEGSERSGFAATWNNTRRRGVPLPSTTVVDVTSDCELMFFVWGSDVVIVDDCSRRVVEIVVNAA